MVPLTHFAGKGRGEEGVTYPFTGVFIDSASGFNNPASEKRFLGGYALNVRGYKFYRSPKVSCIAILGFLVLFKFFNFIKSA